MEKLLLRHEAEHEEGLRKKFGTFGGVFTPTLLTILGVIMYLREGWVIGNAGILGGLLIIFLAFFITACTALSMSSISTNIRIGAGGAYAIVSQSLGLEVGGSLGIPRYVSQALAITLYIFGFREGWLWVFPGHNAFLVDLIAFLTLWGIAYKSADLAIKTQYVIMVVIGASLISIAVAAANGSMQYDIENVGLWGSFRGSPESGFSGTSFWIVFAVFFPAATGIMAGANMSGDLKKPRQSIPAGTLAAVGLSFVIYVLLAYWLARSATPEELTENYYVMVDKAYWGPPVIAGLLGATFSSALASMVGAGRILQAMGEHRILPGSRWLGDLTKAGEPRNAMLVTGAIVFGSLLLRDLNVIAPLITMFFLITYAMLNMVVLIEQGLGLVSFRPLLRVPSVVPWMGLIGSVCVMFIINPIVSLVSVAVVVAFYGVLAKQHLAAPFEDVRSGLFVSFAEWAAKKVTELPTMQERAWKPNLLIPVQDHNRLRGVFTIVRDIAHPKGSVKLLGILAPIEPLDIGHGHEFGPQLEQGDSQGEQTKQYEQPGLQPGPQFSGETISVLEKQLTSLAQAFREHGVFASATVIEDNSFEESLITGMQVLRGAFFKPNILFLSCPETDARRAVYREILKSAGRMKIGVLMHAPHTVARLGRRQTVNVWIRDRSPDWRLRWDIGNLDLSILTAYKFKQNWHARLRLVTVVGDAEQEENARRFMERLMDLARLPSTEVVVQVGSFDEYVRRAPEADLNIFGLTAEPDFDFIRRMVEETSSTCLFTLDSGHESALA